MKQLSVLVILFLCYTITPGFRCNPGPPSEPCIQGVRFDTIGLNFSVINPAIDFHVADTIRLFSSVSDTLISISGNTFIQSLYSLHANINLYKVVTAGGASRLEYANNEFNLQVQTGTLENFGAPGYHILYNRIGAINNLKTSIVPGTPGLYMITVNINRYAPGYDMELFSGSDLCVVYRAIADIPDMQQQLQYWNQLGTTNLQLTNSSYIVTKDRTNYFFVNVIP